MADLYKSFESQTQIESSKEEKRKARQLILDNAKRKFEINEARKEKARQHGEGTWMLDSVTQRIKQDEKELSKAKKKSKKKKKKKSKKKSKGSSSSGTDSEEEEQWVEATGDKNVTSKTIGPARGPHLQRDSWMEAPLDQLIPTTSRQDIRDAINKDKEEARRAAEKAQEPGQHTRELNPYWKDGGSGLPQEKPKTKEKSRPSAATLPSSAAAPSSDGGLSWLQKAYTRCFEQAEEQGRSVEEIAAERWGSLDKLKQMLADAKDKANGGRSRGRREGTPDIDRSNDRHRNRRSGSRERQREEGRRDTRKERSGSIERHREEDRGYRRRERSNSRERLRDRDDRVKTKERDGGKEARHGRDEKQETGDIRRANKSSMFKRPGSDDEDDGKRLSSSNRATFRRPTDDDEDCHGKRRSAFMRPSDDGDKRKEMDRSARDHNDSPRTVSEKRQSPKSDSRRERRSGRRSKSRSPERNIPKWKKKPLNHDSGSGATDERSASKSANGRGADACDKKRNQSPSSSDSSSSSESDKDDEMKEQGEEEHVEPSRVLSEEELNDLAAKILRAEIMGEDDLVSELKEKLEAARKLREDSKSNGTMSGKTVPDFSHRRRTDKSNRHDKTNKGDDDEDNVVVLSRTNKSGMVRPVAGGEEADKWGGGRAGKKRKKAVATHDISGTRTIYFDDDNKFDLKQLVEQEKSGTAEDQNSMFSRLAGKANDRDLDVDDMFVSKAARKQNEEQASAKDRSAAIFEHRKMSAAMEKCSRCFDKVPKHLIIAIGTKSYLCVPPHRSLTEGHCLIVPMQHVTSCTVMDEDVWTEMQLFRKTLVQMFLAQDEDVVVMETVMNLKHFPHTAIECIPLDKEVGDLSPIYFKKAIQEVGPEWADNKKLHSLRDKDVRHVIPKGFPYFSVDFGLQGGYATVIEDEQTFPSYFGREIVGGMVDAEPALWRKPHKQSFEEQRQKVLKFEAMWKPFDFTYRLRPGD